MPEPPSPLRRKRVQPVSEDLKKLKVLFLGDAGSGKSTLAAALAQKYGSILTKHYNAAGIPSNLPNSSSNNSNNSNNSTSTVGVDLISFLLSKEALGKIRNKSGLGGVGGPGSTATAALQVSIWDCAGRGDFADVRSEFHREVHAVCIVADASERRPARNLEKWYSEVVNCGGEGMAGRMVLVLETFFLGGVYFSCVWFILFACFCFNTAGK